MRRLLILASALIATACAANFEAPQNAQISKAQGAPGYVIVGLATQTYKREFGRITEGMALSLSPTSGNGVEMVRNGCGSVRGFYGSKPCDLSKVDREVLVVPPGDWVPDKIVEQINNWGTRKRLLDKNPPGKPVHVGSGEIVYIGDFTYASDYDAQEIRLVQHGRDDAAAAAVLAAYPGLRSAPMIYRDPVAGQ